MEKLKAIISIIFSSEYFVAVSNNLKNEFKPITFKYYIKTDRRSFTLMVKGFLENILSK